MRQEEYLAAIKKQQSLIRKLFANRRRRSEVIDELTRERYYHLCGKFFKADQEPFYRFKGITFFIAAVHGETKADHSDEVVINMECRYMKQSAVYIYPGIVVENIEGHDNIAFFTETFSFTLEDNLDEILAPLYIQKERAVEDMNAMYDAFMKNFLREKD